jgi:hypothetical protein
MVNVKCPSCGRDIRYVVAAPSLHAGNNGLIAVETREEELITEKGRLVLGFKRHKCQINGEAPEGRGITGPHTENIRKI